MKLKAKEANSKGKKMGLVFVLSLSVFFLPIQSRASEFLSNGVKIHYIDEGSGEPVLLIHGFKASIKINWRRPGTIDLLKKSGFRVIALDNRGHGLSDKPVRVEDYGLQMVEDAVRLLDHLSVESAHVVGYSMGGMITMKLMSLHGERVRSAVVGGFGWLKEGGRMTDMLDRPTGIGRGAAGTACRKSWPQLALSLTELKSISTPYILLVGERDRIVRKAYVDPLIRAIPSTLVSYVPDAGHMNCIVKDEFKNGILAFLSTGASQEIKPDTTNGRSNRLRQRLRQRRLNR
jgi:pimeloyl-ACP methyl ester carboxylesterase